MVTCWSHTYHFTTQRHLSTCRCSTRWINSKHTLSHKFVSFLKASLAHYDPFTHWGYSNWSLFHVATISFPRTQPSIPQALVRWLTHYFQLPVESGWWRRQQQKPQLFGFAFKRKKTLYNLLINGWSVEFVFVRRLLCCNALNCEIKVGPGRERNSPKLLLLSRSDTN